MANFLFPQAILDMIQKRQAQQGTFSALQGAPRVFDPPTGSPTGANAPVPTSQGQPQGIPDAERVFKLLTGGMGMQTAPPMDGGRLAAPTPMPQQDYDRTGLNRAKAERDAQFQQLIAMLQGQGQQKPMAPPQYQQPVGYRDLLPVGLAGLLMHLLGAKGNDLGQGLQGFMQGRQGWAEGVNQQRQQQFQVQQQQDARKRGIDTQIGKLKYDQAEGNYNDEKTALDKYEGRQWEKEKFTLGKQEDEVKWTRSAYNSSNLPGEKQKHAARLRIIDPANAPTPEQEATDIAFLKRKNLPDAQSAFQKLVKDELSQFGFVSEGRKDQFESMAQALADNYGVDRADLPEIPAESTLRKKRHEELTAQFAKTFSLRDRQFTHRLAQDKLNYDLAVQRYELARQYAGANFNLSANRFQFDIQKAASKLNGTANSELPKVEADLAKATAELTELFKRGEGGMVKNYKGEDVLKSDAYIKKEEQVKALTVERDALKSMADEAEANSPAEADTNPGVKPFGFDPTLGQQFGGGVTATDPRTGKQFSAGGPTPFAGDVGSGKATTLTAATPNGKKEVLPRGGTPPKKAVPAKNPKKAKNPGWKVDIK